MIYGKKRKEFKARNHDKAKFTGMIRTDGVSVSILLGPQTTKGAGCKRNFEEINGVKKPKKIKKTEEQYFQNVEPKLELTDSDVFIDPNKRDLLYCLGSNNVKLRYTQSQRNVETRSKKYKKIRESLTKAANIQTHQIDYIVYKKVLDIQMYNLYLKSFFDKQKFDKTQLFYGNNLFV